ncbi:leucine-rich repeat and coiled-coil domain-containing protein 1-like isoform X2 [Hydractinia symbiolongicarpus]|nr:leucine-rich repeat and coiled-coil domain-containing protein 1-like isoform X2 [Hydractinia symbiolongicarpus]
MPWLENLDGYDKHGNVVQDDFNSSDIPGLDEYLELLEASSTAKSETHNVQSSSETIQSEENIITPKIDSVLLKFKKRKEEEEVYNDENKENDSSYSHGQKQTFKKLLQKEDDAVTERLDLLEEKLTTLVNFCTDQQKESNSTRGNVLVNIHDESSTDDTASTTSNDLSEVIEKKSERVKPMHSQLKKVPVKIRNKNNAEKKCSQEKYVQGKKVLTAQQPRKNTRAVSSVQEDETYLSLMHEVDSERERRWKAEQASRKLLDNIKILQERLVEERKIQEAAITTSTKLKQTLDTEKTDRKKYEQEATQLKTENCTLKNELDETLQSNKALEKDLKELQLLSMKLEKEKGEDEIHHKKRYKELQMDSGASKRELELLRNTVDKQKGQLQQLQELLVGREQEHKEKQEGMVKIESKEVKDIIEKEVTKCERRTAEVINQHVQRLNERNIEYKALEDEFRMALQIEANRYNELHEAFEQSSNELTELQSTFEQVSLKEAKAKNLVTELSSLVKEQKARITEISKSKQDMQLQYKERLSQVEKELSSIRHIGSKVESLQQDKERMAAHIRGQESVIHGLRSERKLWGQELAQQGASLAQERGRLDAQLESQSKEISLLQNQLKDGNDSLKIKCKLIEGQTETIRKMKQEFTILTNENKRLTDEEKKERGYLEDELQEFKEQNVKLQDSVDALTDRKEELKSNLAETEDELKSCKLDLKKLRHQWDERSKIIDQFEIKVIQMKKSFEEKEKSWIEQKDESAKLASDLKEKLRTLEEKHQLEMETAKHDFGLKLRKVIAGKNDEIQKAKEEVTQVEEEMRIILNDTAIQKKNLEQRVKQLSKAFADIQNDLT